MPLTADEIMARGAAEGADAQSVIQKRLLEIGAISDVAAIPHVTEDLLKALDGAGYVVGRKDAAQPENDTPA
jgi:hypothetical protein